MLGNGLRDTGNVYLLEGVLANKRSGYLTGDGYHGRGIEVSIGNPGYQVGSPRARGSHAYSYLARSSGIAISGMGSALFMSYQNMAKLGVLRQGII
jgi:hypothetical protein